MESTPRERLALLTTPWARIRPADQKTRNLSADPLLTIKGDIFKIYIEQQCLTSRITILVCSAEHQ